MTQSAIESMAEETESAFQKDLDSFLSMPKQEHTFDTVVRSWDTLKGKVHNTLDCLYALKQISPEQNLRVSADQACKQLQKKVIDALAAHPEIYHMCLDVQGTHRTEEEKYYLDQLLFEFEHTGMLLSDEKRALYAKIRQEIAALCSLFHRNIAEDTSALYATKEELAGLPESWFEGNEPDAQGRYKLGCDMPTFTIVLSECQVRKTRQAMFERFYNRGFPANEQVVMQLIAERDKLGKLMGFPSHAAWDLNFQMVGSIDKAKEFIEKVKHKASAAAEIEFTRILKELPEDVPLTTSGKLERFDELYVHNLYKKKHFSLEENVIAEYFPTDSTLQGLIQIYEQFFDLSIREAAHSISIPGLKALEIRNASKQLLGVVLLDLFPRQGKTGHTGVCTSFFQSYSPPGGPDYPGAALIIANFTKPAEGRPALMRHSEVKTFFHEFGHAIHAILGRNQFHGTCGMHVKRDFIEVPSLVLEKWVWDPAILKKISAHYVTHEPLSEALIQAMIQARDVGQAAFVERACFLSTFALALFDEGENKKPAELMHRIWANELPRISPGENNHFYASWWHVPTYGPKFYSYLWSEAFAAHVFEKIHAQGLLNPQAGDAYRQAVLQPGGGKDPHRILIDYLGREPDISFFLNQLK